MASQALPITSTARAPHDDLTTQPRRPFPPPALPPAALNGVCYGPHRAGQRPGGPGPTETQLLEDLRIIARHWPILRMYSSRGPAEPVLRLIQREKLPLKVLLGAWIALETRYDEAGNPIEQHPAAAAANRSEVARAIELANAFPQIVIGVSVGNETQVFWSDHKVKRATLIEYIRQVRDAVSVPVTTADDFNFWNKPESREVAAEVDFILTHIYAAWAGQPLERALPFTEEKYAEVRAAHPGFTVAIGEAGWATRKHTEGDQAQRMKGEVGETQQSTFYRQFMDWVARERIISFYFEAFDEPWKGGPHPDEVEKHWGVYNTDRTPKAALQPGQP